MVYVIGAGFRREDCRRNESLLTWNTQGIQGPQGEKGEKGDQGNPGSQGLMGSQGPNGMDGKDLIEVVGPFDYKFVGNADPCIYNTLGLAGWRIIKAEGVQQASGQNENCQNAAVYGPQWAIFEKIL